MCIGRRQANLSLYCCVLLASFWAQGTIADTAAPQNLSGVTFNGPANSARFTIGLTRNQGSTYTTSAGINESVRIIGKVIPEPQHIGQRADIFVVDRVNLAFTMKTPAGVFVPWSTRVADLQPFMEDVMLTSEVLVDIFSGTLGIGGDHRFFLGYVPTDGALRYTPVPAFLDVVPHGGTYLGSVVPAQGPIAGGTEVTLAGVGFAGASVYLDEQRITPLEQTATSIRLRTPAHDNGYAVISVRSAAIAYGEYLYVPPSLQELPAGSITTVAGVGRFNRDYGPAKRATIRPAGLALDTDGNLYIAEANNDKITRVRPDGYIERVTRAGELDMAIVGDNGPAVDAQVVFPLAVAVDPAGNVYIPDHGDRIRKVDRSGIITTIAGTGVMGFTGDNGPAVQARIGLPTHIAADANDVFFIDYESSRIRRVNLADGNISTFAGTGTPGFAGDNGLATQARFNVGDADKGHLALDNAGNLYLADSANYRIRRINRQSGIITTFYTLPQTLGQDHVGEVRALTTDTAGNVYYAGSGRVVKLNAQGAFVAAWGNGTYSLPVESAPASTTGLGHVTGLAIAPDGDIIFSDDAINRVKRIDVATGTITTVAGIGPESIGENGSALAAVISPYDLTFDAGGNLLFTDSSLRVRKIDNTGKLSTIAGTGSFIGMPLPAPALQTVSGGFGIEVESSGALVLAQDSLIVRIDTAGLASELAGSNGLCAYTGDGALATAAGLCQAWDAVRDRDGNLVIADTNNNRIRRVAANTGVISTIVGNGGPVNGYERYNFGQTCGNGGPALMACINTPFGIAIAADGSLFISDRPGIRNVDVAGTITTFATIANTAKLVFDTNGRLYANVISGVFRLDANGTPTWIAGNDGTGGTGFVGDGGPATAAKIRMLQTSGMAIDDEGNLYFADQGRIRAVRFGAR